MANFLRMEQQKGTFYICYSFLIQFSVLDHAKAGVHLKQSSCQSIIYITFKRRAGDLFGKGRDTWAKASSHHEHAKSQPIHPHPKWATRHNESREPLTQNQTWKGRLTRPFTPTQSHAHTHTLTQFPSRLGMSSRQATYCQTVQKQKLFQRIEIYIRKAEMKRQFSEKEEGRRCVAKLRAASNKTAAH